MVPSADNFRKQFGTRSNLTFCQAWPGSNLFETLMIFLNFFLKMSILKKNQQTTKSKKNNPSYKEVLYYIPRQQVYTGNQIFLNSSYRIKHLLMESSISCPLNYLLVPVQGFYHI